jgi:aminoglycoside/choline kinase family phosphotransferase
MSDSVINFVLKTLNLSETGVTSQLLFGQASARQYFRIKCSAQTYVVMKLPEGFASKAEEITKIADGFVLNEPAFLNVQRYLDSLSIRVPQVLGIDAPQGFILLEDLGDKTLEVCIQNADGEFKIFYYKKAIDALLRLQTQTAAHPDTACVAFHKNFTFDLLKWELNHFKEFGLEDRLSLKLTAAEAKLFDAQANDISRRITELPQGFVHRDFQSRNLMLSGYEFYLIDFQDALMGPVLYDLVALLRDSYVTFTAEETRSLINYYTESLPPNHPYAGRPNDVTRDFNLITLHRKLKDTGRFQFIATVKNNPSFLPHVPLSLAYVRNALLALPDYEPLQKMIAQHLKELE